MSILDFFRNLIGKRPKSSSRSYEFSEPQWVTMTTIAKHEGRPVDELFPNIVDAGLNQWVTKDKLWNRWLALSPREQHVAALACLGYTNNEIGKRLHISPETVKARLQRACNKFDVTSRSQLKMLLDDWDFSEFEKHRYR